MAGLQERKEELSRQWDGTEEHKEVHASLQNRKQRMETYLPAGSTL